MRIEQKRVGLTSLALVAAVLTAGLAGCVAPTAQVAIPSAQGSGDCGTREKSVERGPTDVRQLAEKSGLVLVGEVTGLEASLFNTGDGQAPLGWRRPRAVGAQSYGSTYTPVDVSVERVLLGSGKAGDAVHLLIEGGRVGCITMTSDGAPRVSVGSRYAFVVRPAIDADGGPFLDWQEAIRAWKVDDRSQIVYTDEGPAPLASFALEFDASPPSGTP